MIAFLKKYLGNIYIPILWTLIIGFLLSIPGTMLPSEQTFSIPDFDKFVHFCLFGGFVFSWNLYFSKPSRPALKTLRIFFIFFLLGNAYGIGMEFAQKYLIPFRDFSSEDIIADMIGAGVAYGLSNIWLLPDAQKTSQTPKNKPL